VTSFTENLELEQEELLSLGNYGWQYLQSREKKLDLCGSRRASPLMPAVFKTVK